MDLLGLTPAFIMQVMAACLSDNKFLIFTWDVEKYGEKVCDRCVKYTPEGMIWEGTYQHPLSPENIRLVEVARTRDYHSNDCSHIVTLSYTHGTGHKYPDGQTVDHRAEYGVSEAFGIIELWAN